MPGKRKRSKKDGGILHGQSRLSWSAQHQLSLTDTRALSSSSGLRNTSSSQHTVMSFGGRELNRISPSSTTTEIRALPEIRTITPSINSSRASILRYFRSPTPGMVQPVGAQQAERSSSLLEDSGEILPSTFTTKKLRTSQQAHPPVLATESDTYGTCESNVPASNLNHRYDECTVPNVEAIVGIGHSHEDLTGYASHLPELNEDGNALADDTVEDLNDFHLSDAVDVESYQNVTNGSTSTQPRDLSPDHIDSPAPLDSSSSINERDMTHGSVEPNETESGQDEDLFDDIIDNDLDPDPINEPGDNLNDELSDSTDHYQSDEEEGQLRLAEGLYHLIRGDTDGGCTVEEHTLAHTKHMSEHETYNHHDLSVTYDQWKAWKGDRSDIGINSLSFGRPQGIGRTKFADVSTLSYAFEGHLDPEEPKRNVCLHVEQDKVEEALPRLVADIDSFFVTSNNLTFLRQGFSICPMMNVIWNIETDIHFTHQITYTRPNGRVSSVNAKYKDIPHMYFGTVMGLPRTTVYIFFPHLYHHGKRFHGIKDVEARQFYDHVVWKSCCTHLGTDQVQHLMPSYDLVSLNARARAREQITDAASTRKILAHYPLPAESLPGIWQDMQRRIEDPGAGLAHFRDAFFLVNSKGVKQHYKVTDSLSRAMSQFDDKLHEYFNLEICDPPWIDVARERCGPYSSSYLGDVSMDGDATIYLWKQCCLQQISKRVHGYLGVNDAPNKYTQFFQSGFLRDAASMTISPPRSNKGYQRGLAYAQWYGSYKEPVDAQKVYPFALPELSELAIDPAVGKAFAARKKINHSLRYQKQVRSFTSSKQRVLSAQQSVRHISYGDRAELRVRYDLFQVLMQVALREEAAMPPVLQAHPNSVWVVKTENFYDFLAGNYDKICSTIEFSIRSSAPTGVTLPRTRFTIMLFKYLQAFYSAHLRQHLALSISRRECSDGAVIRGLGLTQTMKEAGFGWFTAVVDWDSLRFHESIASEMIGTNKALISWYETSAVHQLTDTSTDVDRLLGWLVQETVGTVRSERILQHLVHVLLRQYRRDAINKLCDVSEISETAIETDADVDELFFCYDGFVRVFKGSFNLTAGNKQYCKDPAELFFWLWGPSEQRHPQSRWPRMHWDNIPFRLWYAKVREVIEPHTYLWNRIEEVLIDQFWRYHWLVPYPTKDGKGCFTSTNDRKLRQMFGVTERVIKGTRSVTFEWSKGFVRHGTPEKYPHTLSMTMTQLEEYFQSTT